MDEDMDGESANEDMVDVPCPCPRPRVAMLE